MPIAPDQYVDQYLTDFAVDYYNNSDLFIAGKVFPTVGVTEATGLFTKWPAGYFLRDEMRERPLGERPRRIQYRTETGRYACIEEAVATTVDDRQRPRSTSLNINPLGPDEAATRLLVMQALIHQERTWVASFFRAGVWSTNLTGRASSPGAGEFLQFDQAGSDPADTIAQLIDDMGEKGARPANTLTLGRTAFRKLKNHPAVREAIKYTMKGFPTAELLAEYLGVERLFVPGGVQNTAAEGAADAFSYIVPKRAALLTYANPDPSLQEPSAGYTFAWEGLLDGAANAFGGVIERHRDEQARSDIFDIRVAGDQDIVAPDMGVFLTDAVA